MLSFSQPTPILDFYSARMRIFLFGNNILTLTAILLPICFKIQTPSFLCFIVFFCVCVCVFLLPSGKVLVFSLLI